MNSNRQKKYDGDHLRNSPQNRTVQNKVENDLPVSPMQAIIIVILSIFGVLIFGLLIKITIQLVLGQTDWNSPIFFVELLTALPAVFIVRRYRFSLVRAFRLNPISPSLFGWSFILGASIAVIGDQLDRIMQLWLPMPDAIMEGMLAVFRTPNLADFLLIVFIGTIGAGVCEEMLFRGFLQKIIEKKSHIYAAIFIPALLFGILHFNVWAILQISTLGIVLGLLAWRTDSIYPTIIVHALNNFIAMIYIRYTTPAIDAVYLRNELVNPVIVLIAMAIFIVAGLRIWHSPQIFVLNETDERGKNNGI